MIEIMNLRNTKPKYEYDVRVDRESVLGNSHYMRNESYRDEVCIRYNTDFKKWVKQQDPTIIKELKRLARLYKKFGKLRLFCWCAPKRCHVETIRDYILKVVG